MATMTRPSTRPGSSRKTAPKPATPPTIRKTISRCVIPGSRLVVELDRRLDQEDPEVPGDVAHDHRRQPPLGQVLQRPEGARDPGGAGEGQVAGDEVDAAVDDRTERGATHATQPLHQ